MGTVVQGLDFHQSVGAAGTPRASLDEPPETAVISDEGDHLVTTTPEHDPTTLTPSSAEPAVVEPAAAGEATESTPSSGPDASSADSATGEDSPTTAEVAVADAVAAIAEAERADEKREAVLAETSMAEGFAVALAEEAETETMVAEGVAADAVDAAVAAIVAEEVAEAPAAPAAPAAPTASEDAPGEPATEETGPEPATEETAPEPAVTETPAAPRPAPAPRPSPTARPTPRPMPRPRPGARPAPGKPAAPAPVQPLLDPADAAAAASFGEVAEDGTVSVRDGDTVRVVGQVTGADDPLALYVRRYLDLKASVALLETRLPSISVKEATTTIEGLREQLAEPAAVGDLPALRTRVDALTDQVKALAAQAAAEREAAKAAAVLERTAIVEKVEEVAATDPTRMQWRDATATINEQLAAWKQAQRTGVRIDRPTEDALWKRFSHARTAFDKARRSHFATLDKRNAEAKAVKEKLVERAESLADSTDWGPTGAAFRQLMDSWRAAPRGSRKDDDALWARFKAAQDTFYGARNETNAAIDSEYEANLAVKLGLLEQAEKLLPITDIAATKRQLRTIQDAWDEAGRVPRGDIQRVEGRLRAVEQAVRDAEQEELRRSDPALRARADGAAAQLLDAIAGLEADLARAEAAGNAKAIDAARTALAARRQWLEVVQRSQS